MQMNDRSLKSLAAFDFVQGSSKAVQSQWPDLKPADGYRWLHLDLNESSTADWIKETLGEIPATALLQAETRPRCEPHEDGLILNLRGVNLNPESDPEDMVSLRMWVTENAIVSARVRKVFAADEMRKHAEAGKGPVSIGQFLTELATALANRIEEISLSMEETTDQLEEETLDGELSSANRITSVRRAAIKMRRFVHPQREAIANLAELHDWTFSPDELARLREVSNKVKRTVEELDSVRDRLSAIQEHADATRTKTLGRNSYVLSVVAAIFLPLGFLTGLFGVNVGGMPGIESASAFWILTGLSIVTGILLYLVFKFSKWL